METAEAESRHTDRIRLGRGGAAVAGGDRRGDGPCHSTPLQIAISLRHQFPPPFPGRTLPRITPPRDRAPRDRPHHNCPTQCGMFVISPPAASLDALLRARLLRVSARRRRRTPAATGQKGKIQASM